MDIKKFLGIFSTAVLGVVAIAATAGAANSTPLSKLCSQDFTIIVQEGELAEDGIRESRIPGVDSTKLGSRG